MQKIQKSRKDYGEDVAINPDDLEHENLTHASKCMYYGGLYADAIYNRDLAKAKLKLTEAELNHDIQNNWEQHYEKFPSESMRDGWVLRQDKYKIALDIYLKAEHNVNLLKSAKEAFDTRGYSLGNLVSILVSGFNSAPKFRRKEDVNERATQIKQAILSKNPLRLPKK